MYKRQDVDNNDLALALKGANEQVQTAIFNNMSKRLAVMIKEDMEFMGPVRMKDVEEAQQKIVNIIRKLEDSAEIVISRGGGDEIVVYISPSTSYLSHLACSPVARQVPNTARPLPPIAPFPPSANTS